VTATPAHNSYTAWAEQRLCPKPKMRLPINPCGVFALHGPHGGVGRYPDSITSILRAHNIQCRYHLLNLTNQLTSRRLHYHQPFLCLRSLNAAGLANTWVPLKSIAVPGPPVCNYSARSANPSLLDTLRQHFFSAYQPHTLGFSCSRASQGAPFLTLSPSKLTSPSASSQLLHTSPNC
jgi:hypothetical protein